MKSQRIVGYDLIRVIAAFMVVAIHSNVYYLTYSKDSVCWVLVMELTALCVIAVPLFFMVSGAGNLAQEKIITVKDLYSKKIPKQFVPFLLWSVIYIIARMVAGEIPVSFKSFVSLIRTPAYYQFWFMYTLLGLYICIPIFQLLVLMAEKRILQYIIIIWIVGSVLIPTVTKYISGFQKSSHFDFIFLEGYWGYFFLGGYLRKYPLPQGKRVGVLLFIIGIAVTGVASILEWLYTAPQLYYGYVYSAYLLPGAVMASVGAFLVLSEAHFDGKLREYIIRLSDLSMGVYYVHTLIIAILETVFIRFGASFIACVSKWGLVCMISLEIAALLRKIRFLEDYYGRELDV